MKYTLLMVLLLTCFGVFAQEDDPKLSRLYREGKYEKVLHKAGKKLKKDPRNPVLYFYKSKSTFRIYNLDRRRTEKQLNEVLGGLTDTRSLSDKPAYILSDTLFTSSLQKVLQEKVIQYKDKQINKATFYTDYLASHLLDTIDFYWTLYPRQVVELVKYDTVTVKALNRNRTSNFFQKPIIPANRDSVIAFASRFLGTPYKWAGETPAGFDCSGFVLYVMRRFGYDFYHKTTQIAKLGIEVPLDQARSGDIIVFGSRSEDAFRVSHVGILASNNIESRKVIHSVNRGVSLDDILSGYWKDYVLFVRRIID